MNNQNDAQANSKSSSIFDGLIGIGFILCSIAIIPDIHDITGIWWGTILLYIVIVGFAAFVWMIPGSILGIVPILGFVWYILGIIVLYVLPFYIWFS